MQFAWLGFLNQDPDQQALVEMSQFLVQPFIPISAAGALRDHEGARAGMLMLFEADDREAAEALVKDSPFLRAGLYREHHLFEFQNEIG